MDALRMLSHLYCTCKFYTVDYVAIPDHYLEFLCLQTCNLRFREFDNERIIIFQFSFFFGLKNDEYELTKTTCVSVIVGTLTFEMPVGVDTRGRRMTTVRATVTFIDVMTIGAMCLIARLTLAIVPARHIYTIRCGFTCMQTCCTFV